jgi:hypothetical protein
MKVFYFLPVIALAFISCNTKRNGDKVLNTDSTLFIAPADTANIKTDAHYFWSSELDPKKGLVMVKTRPVPSDSITPANIIQMLNDWYPKIPLRYSRVSHDSIFVQISKSGYLTEQMGSSGAQAYLAEVTYNLTEIKDINYVGILFKAGDHASPDIYTRTDFVRVKK